MCRCRVDMLKMNADNEIQPRFQPGPSEFWSNTLANWAAGALALKQRLHGNIHRRSLILRLVWLFSGKGNVSGWPLMRVLTAHNKVSVANNQFAGCSKKYFGAYYAELLPTTDPAWESNCACWYIPSIFCSNASLYLYLYIRIQKRRPRFELWLNLKSIHLFKLLHVTLYQGNCKIGNLADWVMRPALVRTLFSNRTKLPLCDTYNKLTLEILFHFCTF